MTQKSEDQIAKEIVSVLGLSLQPQDAIVAEMHKRKNSDLLGFITDEMLMALDYEHAKSFIREAITNSEWEKHRAFKDAEAVVKAMRSYMSFAFEKANNCRGISAYRSLSHYTGWLWLIGDWGLCKKLDGEYEYYGKPHLVEISEKYAIDWRALDNNEWRNGEDEPALTANEALGRV